MIRDYILIIGSMKSGTTTLFDLLSAHPQVAPCRYKEPGFFAFDESWREGFGAYEQMFDFDPEQHVYGLDGSTDYTKYPHCEGVAERLAASAPRRFKLIYVMRHPLRRIESHARHTQRTRREIGQQISPRPDHSLDAGVSPVSMSAGSYAKQLDQFADAYAAGDLLLLSFEELVEDQQAVLRRVYDFLELSDVEVERVHSNVAGGSKRPIAVWSALAQFKPFAAVTKMLVPKWLRRDLRARLSYKPKIRGRFRLTEEESEQLLEELRPDLERLRDEYNFDTRCWALPTTKTLG